MEANTYDHVDFRVRNLAGVIPFYDELMPALGLGVIVHGAGYCEYYHDDASLPFFGLHESATTAPGQSRIAFAAAPRAQVDRIAAVGRRTGGRAIEGPEVCTDYTQPYYAVFFEDPEGNKFEVCCRR